MRINKYLAECGVGSRRACDKIIEEGRVKINGKVCGLGAEVNEIRDSVTLDGKKLGKVKKYDYYIMNKPKGCVCTVKDDKDRELGLKVFETEILDEKSDLPAGTLISDGKTLKFATADGVIRLIKVQLAGKKAMMAEDLLRGTNIKS